MIRAFTGNTSIFIGSLAVCLGRLLRTRLGTACAASAADSACKTVAGNCDGARACKQASMFCVMPCHPASLNRLHEGKGEESIAVHASDPIAIRVQPACAHEGRGTRGGGMGADFFYLIDRLLASKTLPTSRIYSIYCAVCLGTFQGDRCLTWRCLILVVLWGVEPCDLCCLLCYFVEIPIAINWDATRRLWHRGQML